MTNPTVPQRRQVDDGSMPSRRILRFDDVEVSHAQHGSVSCRVTLATHTDKIFVGEGRSVVLGQARMDAAARAAVHAVSAFAEASISLEGCGKAAAGGRQIALVLVSVKGERTLDLPGAVVIVDDESKAAALAVLDATNRWIETRARVLQSVPQA